MPFFRGLSIGLMLDASLFAFLGAWQASAGVALLSAALCILFVADNAR